MNTLLKIGLIPLPVRARRAVPLPFKIGLCAFALTAATLASAGELGRLFFTPEQRARLERGQQSNIDKSDNLDPQGGADSLTISGIVQKHGGERTIWINGVPKLAGKSDERSPESVPVTIPGQSKQIRVKVGQRVMLNTTTSQNTPKPNSPKPDTAGQTAADDD